MISDEIIFPKTGTFLAGAFSGVCGVLISQPFDTIKVRLQNYGGSDINVLLNLLRKEGLRSLWKGYGASLVGACTGGSLCFGIVENFKRILMTDRVDSLTIKEHALCGFLTGVLTSFISTPTEGARIIMQTQGVKSANGEIVYKNSLHFSACLAKKHGISGLYRGFLITLARNSIGDAFFFATYQGAPRFLFGGNENTEKRDLTSIIIGGGLAGCAFWASIYPIDTIKSRIQADSILNPKYFGSLDCFLKTVKSDGFLSLYKGFFTCMLRAFPTNIGIVLGFEFFMLINGRDY